MNDDLNRYLDGDGETGSLDPETRREAELWDRLTASLRAESPGAAPPWLETRVMAQVRQRSPRRKGLLGWLLRPRTLRLSPLTMGGLATAALVVALLPRWLPGPAPAGPGAEATGASLVYVQFMFQAPGARSVAVSGDFNQWAADTSLEDADGDGVWTVRVPMEPGLHEYMFVVDGERWVTDPNADRYADDGFGNRNAVLAVALPEQSS
jgi:hypothetical protein